MPSVKIPRHRIGRTHAAESYRLTRDSLSTYLQAARDNPPNLWELVTHTVTLAQAAAGAGKRRELPHFVRLGSRAAAALFRAAAAPTATPDPTDDLGGLVGRANPIHWSQGFLLAAASRHRPARDALIAFPVERFTDRAWDLLPFYAPLARALYDLGTDADPSQWLADAQQATTVIENVTTRWWVDKTVVPLIACLTALARPARFAPALVDAVRSHKAYYNSTPNRQANQAGWLPVELLGVAALAHDRGIPLAVESEYLPVDLVTGTAFADLDPPDDKLRVDGQPVRRRKSRRTTGSKRGS